MFKKWVEYMKSIGTCQANSGRAGDGAAKADFRALALPGQLTFPSPEGPHR